MKIGFVAVIAILASVVSSSAFGDMHDKRGTKITEVYINSTGAMLIKAEGIPGYLSLGSVGNKIVEVMYSTALAAKLSNHANVWVRYWDATQGYPTVGIQRPVTGFHSKCCDSVTRLPRGTIGRKAILSFRYVYDSSEKS